MSYIERKKVFETLARNNIMGCPERNAGLLMAARAIADISAADVAPIRHSCLRNISISVNGIDSSAECSLCGAVIHNSFSSVINYCPNCGAKMDLEVEED